MPYGKNLHGIKLWNDLIRIPIICGNALIAGKVIIGNNSYIGAGSSLKNGIKIGEQVLIGLGSVVIKSIPDNEIWVGNPAKLLR